MKIKPQKIYAPLYHNKDKFIILVTGGRGSGKSFNVSTFIERLLFEVRHPSPAKRIVHQILYTRYTMVSAHISVIPEFMEKVELENQRPFPMWQQHCQKWDLRSCRSAVIQKRILRYYSVMEKLFRQCLIYIIGKNRH